MNLRLLKIESARSGPFATAVFGLPEPKSEWYAHCLIENPSAQIDKKLKTVQNKHPQLLNIINSKHRFLHFSFPVDENSDTYLPPYIEKLFAEQADRFGIEIKNYIHPRYLLKNDYGLDMREVQLMGIVNVTPDSFSDGGRYLDAKNALNHALRLYEEGAGILDIGGESSRPGAAPVSLEEELKRVIPVVSEIRQRSDVLISVDTTKSRVAERALLSGANWINDISGFCADPEMISVIKRFQSPVVIMHMQGTPRNMQDNPVYENVCLEVDDFFTEKIAILNNKGIDKIILDPGIGFGKRLEDNLDLIRGAALFRRHGYPLLYGTSRKSFIGTITGKPVEERLAGSLASLTPLLLNGVNILRVHDVSATKDFIRVLVKIRN